MIYENEKPTGDESNRAWAMRLDQTWDKIQKKYHPSWQRYGNIYEGNHWGAFNSTTYQNSADPSSARPNVYITVNETAANVDRMLSFLIRRRPKILCKPLRPDTYTSAILQEAILNYEWKERDINDQLEMAVRNSLIYGFGTLFVWFNQYLDDELFDATDGQISMEDYIKEQSPYVESIEPFHFMYDLEAPQRNLDTARWCARVLFKSPGDVLNNKTYDQRVLRQIRGGAAGFSPEVVNAILASGRGKSKDLEDDRHRLVLYEVWDKKFRMRKTFVKGVEEPIYEAPWFKYMERLPFVMVPYTPQPGAYFPKGMIADVEDQQYELNRIRTHQFKHRRTVTGGRTIISGEVEPEEITKFESGADTIKVPTGRPVRDYIAAMEYPQLAPDEYRIEEYIKNDMRSITGVNEIMKGGNLADRTSATEVNARLSLSSSLVESHADVVDNVVVRVARMMLQHIKYWYTKERVIELAGPLGDYWGMVTNQPAGPDGRYWVPYTREDIQGESDIDIESTSAPRTDPAMERQQDQGLLQIILSNPQFFMQMGVQLPEYLRQFFEKYASKEAARWYPPLSRLQPPIQIQTDQGQQGGGGFQSGAPPQAMPVMPGAQQMPPEMQQMMSGAAPAASADMGGLMGALSGGTGQ